MWHLFKKSKDSQDSIDRTKMELAFAKHSTYDERVQKLRYENFKREHERQLREIKLAMMPPPSVIKYLFDSGQMELSEYTKYILDETGLYLPKLKT